MKLFGTFKDKTDNTITVIIYNTNRAGEDLNIDTSDDVRFSEDPITIETDLSDTFDHIIHTTATINLLSKIWLADYLYANKSTSVIVNILRGNDLIFSGYVTPGVYNMDFAHTWDNIEIECVDVLSTLEDRNLIETMPYEDLKAASTTRPFSWFLQQMDLISTQRLVSNLPDISTLTEHWVETGYEQVSDADGNIIFYLIETLVRDLDANSAVSTNVTRRNGTLTPTYIESTDTCIVDGIQHWKEYACVTVNGQQVQTSVWQAGDPTGEMPYVVDTVRVLVGYTNGPMPQPFEYYEHFRLDNVLSNGMIKYGSSDAIGEQIPEYPNTTSNGSYYHFVQGDPDDLYYDPDTQGYYYKDYAWVVMTIDGETQNFNTNQWQKGAGV